MPRRRSQSQKRGLVLGSLGVVFGALVLWGLAWAAGHGEVNPKALGDDEARIARVDRLASRIAKDGRPHLLPDVSGKRQLDLWIQHLGKDEERGWYAIDAGKRTCSLQWDGARFVEPCTGDTFPADGTGRRRYRTRVDGGALYIDLRTPLR